MRPISSHTARLLPIATSIIGALALLSIVGCRQRVPVFDPGSRPVDADGTISGTVRGASTVGRTVEIVNLETGARDRTLTNNAGGFTFKVRPGKYRVELTLLDGEVLVKRPGVIQVNRSDVDAHADFVIGTSRVVRPRFAAPRTHNGLGPPIA